MPWYPVKYKPDMLEIIASSTPFDYSKLESESEIIPQYSFHGSKIENLSSSAVLTVGDRAFEGCTEMRFINLPNCTSVGQYAFSCGRTTYADSVDVYLPRVVNIGANAFNNFRGTDSTADMIFYLCTYVGQSAFAHTSSYPLTVRSLQFPAVEIFGSSSMTRIIADTVDIGENCTSMGSTPLANSTVTNLIVRATTPPTLGSSAGLGNNANITHIYVPADYVNTYKSASRWSSYASIIEAIPA
jgi:hypothetical protein